METLEDILEEYKERAEGFNFAAVFSKDGEHISSHLIDKNVEDLEIFKEIVAVVQRFIEKMGIEDEYEETFLKVKDLILVIQYIDKQFYFVTVGRNLEPLGLYLTNLKTAHNKIREFLRSGG